MKNDKGEGRELLTFFPWNGGGRGGGGGGLFEKGGLNRGFTLPLLLQKNEQLQN